MEFSSKILVLVSILYEGCLLKLEWIPDIFSQQKNPQQLTNRLENRAFMFHSFLRFYNVCDMFTGVNLVTAGKALGQGTLEANHTMLCVPMYKNGKSIAICNFRSA